VRYWISLLATGLAYTALTLLLMPYIAPPSVTIYQAASSPGTLLFMLYGIGPLVPIVFTYNLYLHRVFRDARDDERTEQYG
jgi:cytochrome d ubiquinol oxidase subunit II